MVHMIFQDVFDHHKHLSTYSYGHMPDTFCKILVIVMLLTILCIEVFTYLSLIQLQTTWQLLTSYLYDPGV